MEGIDLARDELLTVAQAATRLRVHPATIARWLLSGRLAGWRRGGRLVTTAAACATLLVPLGRGERPPAFRQAERVRQMDRWTEARLREAKLL